MSTASSVKIVINVYKMTFLVHCRFNLASMGSITIATNAAILPQRYSVFK